MLGEREIAGDVGFEAFGEGDGLVRRDLKGELNWYRVELREWSGLWQRETPQTAQRPDETPT